jgi:hypothetical protein
MAAQEPGMIPVPATLGCSRRREHAILARLDSPSALCEDWEVEARRRP